MLSVLKGSKILAKVFPVPEMVLGVILEVVVYLETLIDHDIQEAVVVLETRIDDLTREDVVFLETRIDRDIREAVVVLEMINKSNVQLKVKNLAFSNQEVSRVLCDSQRYQFSFYE
jgi:rubrerythrin